MLLSTRTDALAVERACIQNCCEVSKIPEQSFFFPETTEEWEFIINCFFLFSDSERNTEKITKTDRTK